MLIEIHSGVYFQNSSKPYKFVILVNLKIGRKQLWAVIILMLFCHGELERSCRVKIYLDRGRLKIQTRLIVINIIVIELDFVDHMMSPLS